jgi:Bacterial protein of unknown function (DUF839)
MARSHPRARRLIARSAVALAAAVAAAPASAQPPGFRTDAPAQLAPATPGATTTPIMTVGDTLAGGYRFESIPDGISLLPLGRQVGLAYVNHETSTVPFPYNAAAPTIANSQNDFDNAQVSQLVLTRDARVLAGRYAVPSSANFQRFCSNFLAGRREGFSRPVLFLNEEATDLVNRTGTAWPAGPGAEQAGVVVAYDVLRDQYRTIYGMGRHNHENSVAIPGYRERVILSGDDTFSAPASQLYMYTAAGTNAVLRDEGALWAFKADDPAVNDYGDITAGANVSGTFIPVPRDIAVGDQTGLENWSNANGAFQFIRVEDIAYDRKTPNVVYFADTGEPRALPDPATGRLRRGPSGTIGAYPNGRVFRMELDPTNPRVVKSLSILIDGDALGAAGVKVGSLIHQPDNLETTRRSILITEDPGSHNQYVAGEPDATTARIWRYDLATGNLEVAARVDQTGDPAAKLGAWESSGVVDASALYGPGAFLVNVQAHTAFVETGPGPDLNGDGQPDWLNKREGGQMLLLRIPGS